MHDILRSVRFIGEQFYVQYIKMDNVLYFLLIQRCFEIEFGEERVLSGYKILSRADLEY